MISSFASACKTDEFLSTTGGSVTRLPVLHAVRNERLKSIMREFNSLMYEQMYTQLELDALRHRRARDISRAAKELAQAAENLPRIALTLGLEPYEQSLFLERAAELRERAWQLYELASSDHPEQMNIAITKLQATCNSCHVLFRGYRTPNASN